MTQIEAVYRDGVFQPLEPVAFVEDQRVRLSIDSCDSSSTQDWFARLRQRHAEFVKQRGPLPDSTQDIAADRLR